jgi:hypothetical protein
MALKAGVTVLPLIYAINELAPSIARIIFGKPLSCHFLGCAELASGKFFGN